MKKMSFGGILFYRSEQGEWFIDPKGKVKVKPVMAENLDFKWSVFETPTQRMRDKPQR